MPKYKSFRGNSYKHLEKFGIPSEEDYRLILEILPSEVKKEDIFVYSVKLCDNLIDREGEFFSSQALVQLSEMFTGTTGILNHEWKSDNQHSRIYKTELITDNDRKNESNEPYQYIVGYAYTINNDKNKPLIDDINAGILKEVSIGFKHGETTPVNLFGREDVHRIDNITDVYEWSFVAVPAQKGAGVVKSFKQEEEEVEMNFKDALAKLKSFDGLDPKVLSVITEGVKGIEEVETLKATIKSLEEDNDVKGAKIKELEDTITSKTFEDALKQVFEGLTPVSDTAKELANSIAEKGITLDAEGKATGVDETKAKLKSDYPYLFVSEESEEQNSGSNDDYDVDNKDEEQEDVSVKSVGKARSIDFSRGNGASVKSVQTVTKNTKRGMSFN